MSFKKHQGTSGKVYSSVEWLENHHSIKFVKRSKMIAELPISEGDDVLDIGCGTGLWSIGFLEKVGPKGSVIGIDIDSCSIDLARSRALLHPLKKNILFEQSEVQRIDHGSFDVIVMFNILCYVENIDEILGYVKKALRPNGILIIKDSNMQTDFYLPDNSSLLARTIEKINNRDLRINGYDPFFAKKIINNRNILNNFSLISSNCFTYLFTSPLEFEEKVYISENAGMYASLLNSIKEHELSEQWIKNYSISDKDNLLNSNNFLYQTTEYLFCYTLKQGFI